MHCIDFGPAQSAALNLAREEHLLARLAISGDLLLFYVNTDAVVIGRNQLPWAEVSAIRMARAGLPLVRRISGGGAVYHDQGNLNFSLLQQTAAAGRPSAAAILEPVVRALAALGLPARLSERNAIFVGQHKVSGTAQYMTACKILTHGTLLVQAELARLESGLKPDPTCRIHSRGRPSVRSPVINLGSLRPDLTMEVLTHELWQSFAAAYGPLAQTALTPEDELAAQRLAAEKYRRWEWNVGRSPQCTLEWEDEMKDGTCRCRLNVERGVITAVEVSGPPDRQDRFQQWADQWLRGRRLGDPSQTTLVGGAADVPADAGAADFHHWLASRLPRALPDP